MIVCVISDFLNDMFYNQINSHSHSNSYIRDLYRVCQYLILMLDVIEKDVVLIIDTDACNLTRAITFTCQLNHFLIIVCDRREESQNVNIGRRWLNVSCNKL